jgi:hypothetical protein
VSIVAAAAGYAAMAMACEIGSGENPGAWTPIQQRLEHYLYVLRAESLRCRAMLLKIEPLATGY